MDEVENADNAISAGHCEHVSLIGEVDREASSAELLDLGHRLEGVDGVKDLDFVAS